MITIGIPAWATAVGSRTRIPGAQPRLRRRPDAPVSVTAASE
jgi:hypothetical protein